MIFWLMMALNARQGAVETALQLPCRPQRKSTFSSQIENSSGSTRNNFPQFPRAGEILQIANGAKFTICKLHLAQIPNSQVTA
jgi:hypothetical protein